MLKHKIYFAGSITGGRDDADLYAEIINHLKNHGIVLTEHFGNDEKLNTIEKGHSDEQIHDRDMEWLHEANIVIAEVTQISMGVGYELGRMTERNHWLSDDKKKHILCLHRNNAGRRLSAMIAGNKNIKLHRYNDLAEAKKIIDEFLKDK